MIALALILDLAAPTPTAPPPAFVYPHICDGPGLDLDGDGAFDPVETVYDSCGTGGCRYVLTVRPAGARPVELTIDGCWFARGARRHHGLFDAIGIWRLGTDSVTTVYRFDGKRFRRISASR